MKWFYLIFIISNYKLKIVLSMAALEKIGKKEGFRFYSSKE